MSDPIPTVDDQTIILSDDEFDSLLATIPLPGLPSPPHSLPNHSHKRKNPPSDPSNDPNPTSNEAYASIQFGDISKYMSNKRKKLQLQQSALRDQLPDSSPPQIFAGMVIHVNGYTNPTLSELRNMIVLHGGTYMAYLDHKSVITHIIASALTPKKRLEFRNYKVVKPEWIVKSVSAGRLLSWSEFRLLGQSSITQEKIAKGELTGGQAVAQRDLFNLAKAPISTRSIQSTPQAQNRTSQNNPSLSRNHSTSNLTPNTIPSSLQSTFNSFSTKPPKQETSKKITHFDPSNNTSNSILLPPLNQPNAIANIHQLPQIDALHPLRNSSATENHKEVTNMSAISCTEPDFIQKYFQQSRLHHLSAWKADLLQRVSILSENKQTGSNNLIISKKKLKGDPSDRRVIMHVDFDCFFISAGLISRPELKGKPLAVCHAKANSSGKQNSSTSEIASCSYEARAFGVQNGQTLGKAQELCPEIQTIPYDFELYEDLSLKFYNILLSYADELQAVSVDECLVDVSSRFANKFSPLGFDSTELDAVKFAEEIRTTIRKATQCEVSIGISYNVLLAKLATKKAKPCGSFFLSTNRVHDVLDELSIDQLPGFGWSQKNEVEQKFLSVRNVGHLRSIPLSRLMDVLGPARGKTLHQYAQGIDDRSLKSTNHERKSVSAVINYGIRFKTIEEGGNDQVQDFLRRLGLEVSRRLTELKVSGRQLTLKIMKRAPNAPIEPSKYMGHGICEEFSKSTKLTGPAGAGVSDGSTIGLQAWKLLQSMAIQPEDLRGIGIQINQLEKSASATKNKPQVQSTLLFQTTKVVEPPARRPGPRQETKAMQSAKKLKILESQMRTPIASTSKITPFKIPNQTPVVIPPASQLDLNVVEELPTSLKTHILKSISTASASGATDKINPAINPTGNITTIDLITPQKNLNPVQTKHLHDSSGLPSVSQVDWKFLAELPSSVRKPIEAAYINKGKNLRHLPPPPPPNFKQGPKKKPGHHLEPSSDANDQFPKLSFNGPKKKRTRKIHGLGPRVTRVGPSQKLISKKTFQLITKKQIPHPKLSTETKEKEEKDSPHELLPTPNRISDEQLEALEIDPRFFRELSSKNGSSSVTRAFQLDLIWNQFQSHAGRFKDVTEKTDRWKRWRKNFDRPSKKILEIALPEPPRLGSKEGGKGLTQLRDILDLIERWVRSHHAASLADADPSLATGGVAEVDERDLAIIEGFLLDSVDSFARRSVGQDLEKVAQIIQWWDLLVLNIFRSAPTPHLPPAIAWKNYWAAILDRFKSKINAIAVRDFGAPIY